MENQCEEPPPQNTSINNNKKTAQNQISKYLQNDGVYLALRRFHVHRNDVGVPAVLCMFSRLEMIEIERRRKKTMAFSAPIVRAQWRENQTVEDVGRVRSMHWSIFQATQCLCLQSVRDDCAQRALALVDNAER